jgi:hypothetical protein
VNIFLAILACYFAAPFVFLAVICLLLRATVEATQ